MQKGMPFSRVVKIDSKEVLFLRSMSNYISIELKSEQQLVLPNSMCHIFNKINDRSLVRINRSVILNIQYVKGLSEEWYSKVLYTDGSEQHISRRRKDSLKRVFNNFKPKGPE